MKLIYNTDPTFQNNLNINPPNTITTHVLSSSCTNKTTNTLGGSCTVPCFPQYEQGFSSTFIHQCHNGPIPQPYLFFSSCCVPFQRAFCNSFSTSLASTALQECGCLGLGCLFSSSGTKGTRNSTSYFEIGWESCSSLLLSGPLPGSGGLFVLVQLFLRLLLLLLLLPWILTPILVELLPLLM